MFLAAASAAVTLATNPPAEARPVVQTNSGPVVGVIAGGAESFQGIPYAAAPTGALRWAPPTPRGRWKEPLDASRPGSACPQVGPAGGIGGNIPGLNEDCLFLNVWRPAGPRPPAEGPLPVLVWFHGGGMQSGAAHLYRGSGLATRGRPTIVVTVNYRLSILGFMAHPGLDAEQPQLGSGNYGILDQQSALRWVRENIASFGGDPQRITIAGESGGAQAVCVQLASPTATGLFKRAISESGGCQWRFPTLTAADAMGEQIAASHGCTGDPHSVVDCLRKLPVAELLKGAPGTGAPSGAPAVGGGVLPRNIREAIAFGRFNRVPVMQGATRDEALYYVAPFFDGAGKPIHPDEYFTLLSRFFGGLTPQVVERYPLAAYPSASYALSAAIGDSGAVFMSRIGACNTRLAHQLLAPWTTVFAFDFADPNAPFPAPMFPFNTGGMKGPGHTSELTYLWDTNAPLAPPQRALSDTMIKYWTNFVATGDPNGPDLPPWPAFRIDQESVQSLVPDAVQANAAYAAEHNCEFWNQHGFNTLYSWAGASGPTTPRPEH